MTAAENDNRRTYVREMSSRLGSIVSTRLDSRACQSLAQVFKEFTAQKDIQGADVYNPLFKSLGLFCETMSDERNEVYSDEANEVFKSCVIRIQTSLFLFAVSGRVNKSQSTIKSIQEDIDVFLTKIQSKTPAKKERKPLESQTKNKQDQSENTKSTALSQAGKPASETKTPIAIPIEANKPKDVHSAINSLAEYIWSKPTLRPDFIKTIDPIAAHESTKFSNIWGQAWSGVSLAMATPTPNALIESDRTAAIRDQLNAWLKDKNLDSTDMISASARNLGKYLHLAAWKSGKNKTEVLGSGIFETRLSIINAYAVKAGGKNYLIPACDVVGTSKNRSNCHLRTQLPYLFTKEQIAASEPTKAMPELRIRWYDQVVGLGVESISGPDRYIVNLIPMPTTTQHSPLLSGIAGISRLDDGNSAAVLELYTLFNEYFKEGYTDRSENPSSDVSETGTQVLVRIDERVFGFPSEAVIDSGWVKDAMISDRLVQTQAGMFYLHDLRELLKLEGGVGHKFIVVSVDNSSFALAIDDIEGACAFAGTNIDDLDSSDPLMWNDSVRGQIGLTDPGSGGGQKAYLLDMRRLFSENEPKTQNAA